MLPEPVIATLSLSFMRVSSPIGGAPHALYTK